MVREVRDSRRATSALIGLLLLLAMLFSTRANAVVSTLGVSVAYVGDGTTSVFSYPDYLFEAPDLSVGTSVNGVVTTYSLGNLGGFTFTGTADLFGSFPSGGNVHFVDTSGNPAPPALGVAISITRATPKTQLVAFLDNNPMAATVVEHAYDKLTLMAQENAAGSGAAVAGGSIDLPINFLGKPTTGALGRIVMNRTVTIPANYAAAGTAVNSVCTSHVAFTGSVNFVIEKEDAAHVITAEGNCNFGAGASVGVFASNPSFTLLAGQSLLAVAPTQDTTGSDISITIGGSK